MTIPKEDEPKRSYGLRGGKRIYEGHDDERKVKGRKKKEEARGKHYYAKEFSKTNSELPKKTTTKLSVPILKNIFPLFPTTALI